MCVCVCVCVCVCLCVCVCVCVCVCRAHVCGGVGVPARENNQQVRRMVEELQKNFEDLQTKVKREKAAAAAAGVASDAPQVT